MKRQRISITRSSISLDLSLENLAFIFGNLVPPFEHGIHIYRASDGKNRLILDEWAGAMPHAYIPSKEILGLNRELLESGFTYAGSFHNHVCTDAENDRGKKVLILPSNSDVWGNSSLLIGLVRNFRNFSDLRVFLNSSSYDDYPYPPGHFLRLNTPIGRGTRIISSKGRFSAEDEEKIEFEDNGYVARSMYEQAAG